MIIRTPTDPGVIAGVNLVNTWLPGNLMSVLTDAAPLVGLDVTYKLNVAIFMASKGRQGDNAFRTTVRGVEVIFRLQGDLAGVQILGIGRSLAGLCVAVDLSLASPDPPEASVGVPTLCSAR